MGSMGYRIVLLPILLTLTHSARANPCEGLDGTCVPHETSCNKFLKCVQGVPEEHTCRSGRHFDVFTKECLPSDIATCHAEVQSQTTEPNDESCADKTQTEITCDANRDQYRVPDPKNCRYYYLCYKGVPIHERCPGIYEFSSLLLICTFPTLAKCIGTPSSTLTTSDIIKSSPEVKSSSTSSAVITIESLTTTEVPNSPTISTITQRPDHVSCDRPKKQYLLPDPNDCRYFYICSFGMRIHMLCAHHYEFSPFTLTCTHASKARCRATTTTLRTTIPAETQTTLLATSTPQTTTTTTMQTTINDDPITSSATTTTEISTITSKISTTPSTITTTPVTVTPTEVPTKTTEVPITTSDLPIIMSEIPTIKTDVPTIIPTIATTEGPTIVTEEVSTPRKTITTELPTAITEFTNVTPATATTKVPTTTSEILTTPPAITTTEVPTITTEVKTTPTVEPLMTSEKPLITTTTHHPHYVTCDDAKQHYRLPDPDNCRYYYVCYYGKKLHLICANRYEFNPFTLECMKPSEAQCGMITTTSSTMTTSAHTITPFVTKTPQSTITTEDLSTITEASITTSEIPTIMTEESIIFPIVATEVRTTTSEILIKTPSTSTASTIKVPNTITEVPITISEEPTSPPVKTTEVLTTYSEIKTTKVSTKTEIPIITTEGSTSPPVITTTEISTKTTEMPEITKIPTKVPTTTTEVQTITTKVPTTDPITTSEEPSTTQQPHHVTCDNARQHYLLPDPDNCRYYYECYYGKKLHLICANHYEFNPFKVKCMHSSEAQCSVTTTTSSMIATTAHTTTPFVTSTPQSTSITGVSTSITEAPIIPPMTIVTEIPITTSKFSTLITEEPTIPYVMSTTDLPITKSAIPTTNPGVPTETSETPITTTEVRTIPSATTTTEIPTTTTDKPATTTEISTTVTIPPATTSHEVLTTTTEFTTTTCDRLDEQYLLPDPDSYNYYYVCSFGNRIHLQCSNHYKFDPIILKCLLQSDTADRISWKSPSNITARIASTSSTSPVISISSKSSTVVRVTRDRRCKFTSVHYRIKDPDNCNYYYLCYYGIAIREKCPYDFVFSPAIKECLEPDFAECNITRTVSTSNARSSAIPKFTHETTTDASFFDVCESMNFLYGLVPDPSDCRYFYMCLIGLPLRDECPKEFEFDPNLLKCVPKSNSTCVSNGRRIRDFALDWLDNDFS